MLKFLSTLFKKQNKQPLTDSPDTPIGDVYLTRLDQGFWGAFKVVKRGVLDNYDGKEVLMVAILDLADLNKPTINDPRLKEILRVYRFQNNGKYAINFISANERYNEVKDFEFLGRLPLTDFEQSLPFKLGGGDIGINSGFGLSGTMHNVGYNTAFYEWRWQNEREAFVKEIEESDKRAREIYEDRVLKPKKMMDDTLFWELIALLNWKEANDEMIVQPLIKHLSKLKVNDIKQFQENLTYKLYCLDTKAHAKNIGEAAYDENGKNFSVDQFLYARCAAIANGKEAFESALKDPAKMPRDIDFEPLISIAETTYELKTDKDFEYETGCDYETFSNKAAWK